MTTFVSVKGEETNNKNWIKYESESNGIISKKFKLMRQQMIHLEYTSQWNTPSFIISWISFGWRTIYQPLEKEATKSLRDHICLFLY